MTRPPDTATGPTAPALEDAALDERTLESEDTTSRLETLLEFAPALIIAVSLEGTIDYINRVLPQYSRAEVIGTNWLKYVPPAQQVEMQAILGAVLKDGVSRTYEATTGGPDGAPVWFSSQIGPIRRQGVIVGAVIVPQDVTEKKRAESELLAARRLAVLGTMAAGVAHEINTPIQYLGDSLRSCATPATTYSSSSVHCKPCGMRP